MRINHEAPDLIIRVKASRFLVLMDSRLAVITLAFDRPTGNAMKNFTNDIWHVDNLSFNINFYLEAVRPFGLSDLWI